MTRLLDHPAASGSTVDPAPEPCLPGLTSAVDFRNRDIRRTGRRVAIQMFEPDGSRLRPPWLADVEDQFSELASLPPRWDGGRAKPVSRAALEQTASLLVRLLTGWPKPVLPQLFPLCDGGIQIEWHADGIDIEIEVDAAGSAHVFASENGGTVVAEGELSQRGDDLLTDVSSLLAEVAGRVASSRDRPDRAAGPPPQRGA